MKITAQVAGIDAVRGRLAEIKRASPQALAATAVQVEDIITEAAGKHSKHSRTGMLVRSIFKKRDGDDWLIGHDLQVAPHARWVIQGARPHLILPRRKKVLRWAAGGEFVFAKRVRHPGYRGDDYLTAAAAQAPKLFKQNLDRLMPRR